jgi:hypothetical protein
MHARLQHAYRGHKTDLFDFPELPWVTFSLAADSQENVNFGHAFIELCEMW